MMRSVLIEPVAQLRILNEQRFRLLDMQRLVGGFIHPACSLFLPACTMRAWCAEATEAAPHLWLADVQRLIAGPVLITCDTHDGEQRSLGERELARIQVVERAGRWPVLRLLASDGGWPVQGS